MDFLGITRSEIRNLRLEIFLKLIENEDINELKFGGEPLIFSLIIGSRFDIIERLKNINVNVRNSHFSTPLHISYSKKINMLLIERGADINAKDEDGNTFLHFYSCDKEMVSFLLEKGVDINVKNNLGQTPLSRACFNESYEVIKLLLESGAEVEYEEDELKCLNFNSYIGEAVNFHPQDKIEEMKELINSYQLMNKKGAKKVEK